MVLPAFLLAIASVDADLPWTLEIHPAGLVATGWLLADPTLVSDETSPRETRLVQLEVDAAWRFAPTASLVASVSTFPTVRAEIHHLDDDSDLGRSTHEVRGLSLDAGLRRHPEDRRGWCVDVLATLSRRDYRAHLRSEWSDSSFAGSQWRIGLLGKPGLQWNWGRFTVRTGIGVGLEWTTRLNDPVLLEAATVETLQNGGTLTRTYRVHGMDGLPSSGDGGVQPQGEIDFAVGWRL